MVYDIFISYKRRNTSSAVAALVYNYLTQKGYKVFFDRKEIRQGRFNEQLYNHIEGAKDIIILLEETSLKACFNDVPDAYKGDWFCKEVMHALELEKDKHIIPVLLGGYKMPEPEQLPEEMKTLPLQNAISLDASEMDEVFQKYFITQGYLQSKPQGNIPGTDFTINNGDGISDFLFYTSSDCDIYECGENLLSLSADNDEEHPCRYSVRRSGEHRFHCINNDTCEEIKIIESIETGGQKYIELKWTKRQNLWKLTDTDISSQMDADILFEWGNGLFWGTSTHKPDLQRAFACLSKSVALGNEDAKELIVNKYAALFDRDLPSEEVFPWLEKASELGSTKAELSIARYYEGKDDEKSVALCTEAANEGDVDAINWLGRIYLTGEQGVEVNAALAESWLEKAISKGSTRAMCNLAFAYERGWLPKNEEKAVQLYQLAVDNGSKKALTMLGNCYRNGIGVEQNMDKAVELYKQAVRSGSMDEVDPWSQFIMGLCFAKGDGVEKDGSKALEWFYKAARNGEGEAQAMYHIGRFHFYGIATEQNYKQAFEWFRRACEVGDQDSNLYLGWMYKDGLYVECNYETALEYFTKAADAGNPRAMTELGILYINGNGIEKDVPTAVQWFRKAAELGEEVAQRKAAFSYIECPEEERDLQKALYWFELSADQGDVISLYLLGEIYSHKWSVFRDLVPKDMNKALACYLKAAEDGYQEAQYRAGQLYEYQDVPNFKPNYEKAMYWYEQAAVNEFVPAYEAIGHMYEYGLGVEMSEEKHLEWSCKAIEKGYMYSIEWYAGRYKDNIPEKIINAIVVASQNGNKRAKYYLAQLYLSGKAKCDDTKLAVDILTEASNEGDLQARYQLALFYMQRHYPLHKYHVEHDVNKAKDLFESLITDYEVNPYLTSGALPEHATGAYYNLGILYKSGRCVPKDEDKALVLFEKAATNGPRLALAEIVKIQEHRYDDISKFYVPMSNKDLLTYALAGFREACEEMSRRYREGDRQERNDDMVRYWHRKGLGEIGQPSFKQRVFSIFSKRGLLHVTRFQEPQKWIWQK